MNSRNSVEFRCGPQLTRGYESSCQDHGGDDRDADQRTDPESRQPFVVRTRMDHREKVPAHRSSSHLSPTRHRLRGPTKCTPMKHRRADWPSQHALAESFRTSCECPSRRCSCNGTPARSECCSVARSSTVVCNRSRVRLVSQRVADRRHVGEDAERDDLQQQCTYLFHAGELLSMHASVATRAHRVVSESSLFGRVSHAPFRGANAWCC